MVNRYLILIGSLKKGGAERNASILANQLISEGYEVTIALFIQDIAFQLDHRVDIVHINHKKYTNKIFSTFYVLFKLRKLVNHLKPKRLIAMSRVGGLLASSIVFSDTVVRFDSYPLIGYKKYKQWQFWFFYNLPWVRYVVCPSQELREDVLRYFINKKKLVTIYNPVPFTGVVAPLSGAIHSRPYFVIVSRLNSQKNIARVIETYHQAKIFQKADLIIIGDGPQMDHLRSLVRKLGMEDCVILKGFIRDPYPYIQQALILINASLKEGFPNVVVEALSLDTPVICSLAKTGPKEIIFPGENGLLFQVGDYAMLGNLMEIILSDHELYRHLKNNTGKGLNRFDKAEVMKTWNKILL